MVSCIILGELSARSGRRDLGDQDGDEIDILVQKRKDKHGAKRFSKKLLKGQKATPVKIVSDRLVSCSATTKEMNPCVEHSAEQYENNRCELSHQPTRNRNDK